MSRTKNSFDLNAKNTIRNVVKNGKLLEFFSQRKDDPQKSYSTTKNTVNCGT